MAGAYTLVDRAERLLDWRAERGLTEGIRHSLQWAALRDEILSGPAESLTQR
jgi:UDP-glucose 4-epimerase